MQPELIFDIFSEIRKVPRPSKHEGKIIEFLKEFGRKHGIDTHVDKAGNVLMKMPATPGMENRKGVILQAHMDMVCDSRKGVTYDPMTSPIKAYVDGEWLRAEGTTLGADDGLGIAIALAALTDKEVKHGPIECLFTVDEETGLTGAMQLQAGFMEGEILLNLDSEDEGEIFIGCAGGIQTTVTYPHFWEPVPKDYVCMKVELEKFKGGHSGDDINKNRANAIKVLTRFLLNLDSKYEFCLCSIDGGNKHNAIPREAVAIFGVPEKKKEAVCVDFNVFAAQIRDEYAVTEPDCQLLLGTVEAPHNAIDRETAHKLLLSMQAVDNGVFAMSQDVPGLVETSSNLASVKMADGGEVKIVASQRSSTASQLDEMVATIKAPFELAGARILVNEGYPGWKPNVHSPILKVAVDAYRELFGTEAKVRAIHAGLECGLFLEKYPNLDMISFGPTLRDVHTPDERLEIATVDKCWRHLKAILERIPQKE